MREARWSDSTRKIMIESMTKLRDAYKDFIEKSLIANGIDRLNAKIIAEESISLDEYFGYIPESVFEMAKKVTLRVWDDGYISFTPTIKAGFETDDDEENKSD